MAYRLIKKNSGSKITAEYATYIERFRFFKKFLFSTKIAFSFTVVVQMTMSVYSGYNHNPRFSSSPFEKEQTLGF